MRILLSTCAVVLLSTAAAAAKPKPDFTFSPSIPAVGELVTFTPSPRGALRRATVDWDFQNDNVPDVRNVPAWQAVTYSYPQAGTFNVRMLVRRHNDDEDDEDDEDDQDDDKDVVSAVKPIRVNAPPVVQFAVSPRAPIVGQEVFLQSFSNDPDGAVVSQRWDLDGDGDFDEDANGKTARTIFTRAGARMVRLEVRDSDGGLQSATQAIRVRRRSIAPFTSAGLSLMNPFPLVRLAGSLYPRGVKVRALEAKKAPPDSTVTVLCAGKSCPSKKIVKTAEKKRVRFEAMTRFLWAGTIISVSVRKNNLIGKYTRWRIRGGKLPKRTDRCLYPNRREPVRCPA